MKLLNKVFGLKMDSVMLMLFVFFLVSSHFSDGVYAIFFYALSAFTLLASMSTHAIVKAIKENKEGK